MVLSLTQIMRCLFGCGHQHWLRKTTATNFLLLLCQWGGFPQKNYGKEPTGQLSNVLLGTVTLFEIGMLWWSNKMMIICINISMASKYLSDRDHQSMYLVLDFVYLFFVGQPNLHQKNVFLIVMKSCRFMIRQISAWWKISLLWSIW